MTDFTEAGFISDMHSLARTMSDIRESFISEGFTREESMQVICSFVSSISGKEIKSLDTVDRYLERIDAGA